MPAQVRIDPNRQAVPFNRMIFGQFLEHFHRQVYGGVFDPGNPLSDRTGLRTDVVAALRDLGVPIVRWPGGCFASAYHWRDGVGPERASVYDKAWHVEEPNTFGTHEFVAFCRAIGAEPYICTNAGTGSPEEMSDWVEYCNADLGKWARLRRQNGSDRPMEVQYWSIGNENYGAWELGAKKADDWAAVVTESAKMMLRADHTIKLLAAAKADPDWTLPLLAQAGPTLSYVSIHGYWDALWKENTPSDYATCMQCTGKPEQRIRKAEAILAVAGLSGKVAIAFDEWNLRGWHHPDLGRKAFGDVAARDANDINATYTMADAVFSACFLNACLRHAHTVGMACMAPVVNARGPLFVHPDGIVKRTTYHVLKMYADLLEPCVIDCWTDGEDIEAVATADQARTTLSIALVNRHVSEALGCALAIDGAPAELSAEACILDGDSPDAYNDIETPDRVCPRRTTLNVRNGLLRLPPHSVTILRCPA